MSKPSRPAIPAFINGQHTAEEKRKFAESFIRFVEGGFKQSAFHKPFYTRLSMTFGHIAHYNIHGFYDAQFSSLGARIDFVEQCLQWPCYGQPQFTYCDVERFLQEWLKSTGLINRLLAQHRDAVRAAELTELARLKSKHEPQSASGTQLLCSLFT